MLAEAERVLDDKHAQGPEKLPPAILAALKEIGATPADINAIVVADTGLEGLEHQRPELVAQMHDLGVERWGTVAEQDQLPLGPIAVDGLRADVPILATCHHASHAAGSVWLSGFGESLNCVLDGYGVCCGTAVYDDHGEGLKRVEASIDHYLLGWRYQVFGHFVQEIDSWQTNVLDLAGKVMGLNAYGTPREAWVRRFESYFEGPDFQQYAKAWDSTQPWFADLIGGDGLHLNCRSARDPVLLEATASMQEAYSRVFERVVLGGLARSGARDVTLSGGCALNVLANTRVAALPQVERLYVQPTAGDNGLPIGAAALGQHFLMGQPLHAPGADAGLRADPYRGVALEIDVPLPGRPMPAAAPETAPALAGRLLAGEVISMATGRCEMGPRSLGHRSVLAYPNGEGLRDRLNRLKAREWWRPFAPVCRLCDAERFFEAPAFSPYMLLTALVRDPYRERLAAASHDDGTARLQVLPDRDSHPLLWDILTEMDAKSGVGVLVNTSFNVSGKPLLNRASTALQILRERELDGVWIEGMFAIKADLD